MNQSDLVMRGREIKIEMYIFFITLNTMSRRNIPIEEGKGRG